MKNLLKITITISLAFILTNISFAQNNKQTNHKVIKKTHYYYKNQPKDSIKVGVTAGCIAPDIVLKNVNNKELKLSDLRGKVVLIQFWSSKCSHCRHYNKDLVKTYLKYKDSEFEIGKGFEIYSISLDTRKADWERAIAEDSLIWENHVNDYLGWSTNLKKIFKFNKTPTTFLIDEDGIIIQKNAIGQGLNRRLEYFLKNKEVIFR